MSIRFVLSSALLFALCLAGAATIESRLPNGRLITPQGDWLTLAPYPFALAIHPSGRQIVVPSMGYPFSLNIVDGIGTASPKITRIPNSTKNSPDVEVYAGVAYSADGRTLYDATGDSGAVDVLSTETWKRRSRLSLNGPLGGVTYANSFASTLVLSQDNRFLYVLDQGNWRVVVFDCQNGQRISSIPTGSNPLTLALSSDQKRLYIANSGLFEYQLIEGVKEKDIRNTGLHFPPFGYPSKAARQGGEVEGHKVKGLGDENDVRGSSLWTYDIGDPQKPAVIAKLRLGAQIQTKQRGVVGGASPSGVIGDERHVYVTLAHQDVVVVADVDGKKIQQEISLTPFSGAAFEDASGRPLRGIMPSGMAQDKTRLYIAESGIDAVAVIDKESNKVLGHLPVGWYPSAAVISPDGNMLYVVNTKGKGTGPNGGSTFPADAPEHYIGDLEFGSLSSIPLPLSAAILETTTATVIRNNQSALVAGSHVPHLKHAFLIIRENRTFDEVFGDLSGVNGEPKLARYGEHGWTSEKPELTDVRVTPNAHALARQFATSDSFYVDSDVSADGHRWALGVATTPWMNQAWTSAYEGRRKDDPFSASPGRRAMGGGADAPMPEDEPEFGSLWEHIAGSGLSLRNYGEGLEVEGGEERDEMEPEGQRLVLNSPIPQPIFVSTDRKFPTFNLGIPDQFRYQEFAKDFGKLAAKGKAPAMTVIRLPNDHTTRPRPGDGYPYRASYVADNDLALGKIVEWISHSPIWPETAIFVIEDDAQSGVDHVDAHRSPLLVMGPHVKKGFISHRHTSMPSVQKTIYELLGLGPLNLEDALAADLGDMFTDTPDVAPFKAEPSDPRVFDAAKAKIAHPKTAAEARELLEFDNPRVIQTEFKKQTH